MAIISAGDLNLNDSEPADIVQVCDPSEVPSLLRFNIGILVRRVRFS